MVHIIDGVAHPGHRPRQSDEYQRQPTVFQVDEAMVLDLSQQTTSKPRSMTRYHLMGSADCPWFHRTLLIRALNPFLHEHLQVSFVDPIRDDDDGWAFSGDGLYRNNVRPEDLFLKDTYIRSDPKYTGNVTTPVLLDAETDKIVCNESRDILKILQRSAGASLDYLYPFALRAEIDALADKIQNELNNGVYRSGLARSQEAYEKSVGIVFKCLDGLEERLSESRFLLTNDCPTLADLMLLPTLLRFDDIYFVLFKCSTRRLSSYYNLINYTRDLYQATWVTNENEQKKIRERLQESARFDEMAQHYFTTFDSANPNKVMCRSWTTLHKRLSSDHDRTSDRFGKMSNEERAALRQEGTEVDQKGALEKRANGEFVRGVSAHRNWIGDESFPVESGRYTLVVANNCPWCHRTTTALHVLGLSDAINVDVCFYRRDAEMGWQFLPPPEELRQYESHADLSRRIKSKDSTFGKKYVREIYETCGSKEKSVPLLIDSVGKRIVSNESADIIRMFNQFMRPRFSPQGAPDLFPPVLQDEIERLNAIIYSTVNNGAYKAGFTSDQAKYDAAYDAYFSTLDKLDGLLAHRRFLLGDKLTETDIRLFPTLARHDACYSIRMKLNGKMILDMPNLSRWLRDVFRVRGVSKSWFVDDVIIGYFGRTGNNLIPMSKREDVGGALGAWY